MDTLTQATAQMGGMKLSESDDHDVFWKTVLTKFKGLDNKTQGNIMRKLTRIITGKFPHYKEMVLEELKAKYTGHDVSFLSFKKYVSNVRQKLAIPSNILMFYEEELKELWEELKKK